MKTRILIIIGIIVISTIPFVTFAILDRYSDYVEQMNYIAENKSKEPKPGEKYYIEPELKAKLEEIELDLREKVSELHHGLPPSSYAVNLDHQTKEIVVLVENKDLISKIEDITKQYPENVSFVITHGKITLDDFDKTWDGPGNRHPAFLGYYIPDVCTNDMVKFLKEHSDMFDNSVPYSSPLDGDVLDPVIDPDDMVQCENELLENRDKEPSWNETVLDSNCGTKYMLVGNNKCVLNPEFIEPNTIIIYDVVENGGTRLAVAPSQIVMNLTNGNTVTFVNDGLTTVNIFDHSKGIWRFDNVKPSSQRTLIINETGFYEFLIQNSLHGQQGRIAALSDDTNSLPVGVRAKMAQTIIGSHFGEKYNGLISVGAGGLNPGITIGIDEKVQNKYDDAEKFYYEKYRNMIPFDIPITIEFSKPIELQ